MQGSNPRSRSPPITMVTTLSPRVANPSPCTRATKGPGSGSFENIKEVDLGQGPSGDDEGGREAEGGMRARPGLRGAGQHSSPGSGGQRGVPSLRPPGSSPCYAS